MEQLYKDARTLERMRAGLLGAYVDAFARQLIDQGTRGPRSDTRCNWSPISVDG